MVVPPYICGCQEIFWICVTKRIWYADHTTVLACPQQLPEMPKYEVSGRRFGLPTSEVGLSSAAVRKCARPYRSRADEAVKCCRVCRDDAKNAQGFLADEVIHYSTQELWEVSSARCDSGCDAVELSHYWLAFRFNALGLGGGKCRLARACIERSAFGAEIEEVVLRSRLWRIPKRPLPPASPQTLLSWRGDCR